MKSQIKRIFEVSNNHTKYKPKEIHRYDFNAIDFKNNISIYIFKNYEEYTEIKNRMDKYWSYILIILIWMYPAMIFEIYILWFFVLLWFLIMVFLNAADMDKIEKIDKKFWELTDIVSYYPLKNNKIYFPLKDNRIYFSWQKHTLYNWKDITTNDYFITKI